MRRDGVENKDLLDRDGEREAKLGPEESGRGRVRERLD